MARRAHGAALLAASVVLAAAGGAAANGRYPNASLIVFDPNDVNHLVASATFGLLETRDGGRTFLWRCEAALQAQAPQDVMVAITENGAMVAAKFDGIVATRDGCSFRAAPELAGKNVVDLALSRGTPSRLVSFYVGTGDSGGLESQIMGSDDSGRTWAPLGPSLPEDLLPLTIDVAGSDASRVYVSGRLEMPGDYASVLFRSSDGGHTFQAAAIPETSQHRLAYIAAVHPFHPDVVYLRVNDPLGTRIWITENGGITFRKLFTGNGQLLGFAVSPDGTRLALGGPADGVWVGAADGADLTRRSDVLPTCLAWSAMGLWACADQNVAPHFSIGLSRDDGATFEPVLRFQELCANTGCAADTAAGSMCAADWELVAPMIGTTCGTRMARADAATDGAADAAGVKGRKGGNGGCGCALSPASPWGASGAIFLLALLRLRRKVTATAPAHARPPPNGACT